MSIRFNWFKSGRCLSVAFTLVELLIVFIVIAILCAVATPLMTDVTRRTHFVAMEQSLLEALYFSKSMAVIHASTVLFCGSSDGASCDGNWNAHWLVIDAETQHRLRMFQWDHSDITVHWIGNFEAHDAIHFNALGETGGQQGHFVIQALPYQSHIILIESGRARLENVPS